ncbi:MAG: type II toxin-antitoxin system RelE/ParE family toxin [Caldilinea sp. CFX5]|nr:type II toxin-antitoxin system RelE/ParE family toxin [Caldilinea sp. CFX5]
MNTSKTSHKQPVEYTVIVPKQVQKQLDDLPQQVKPRVVEHILELKTQPRPPGCVKLKGYAAEYRIRVGDYRVRYEFDDQGRIVLLLVIKHRKDVYQE